MKRHSGIGLTIDEMKRQCFNIRMYGVRDGIEINDSLPNGTCQVIEQAGEVVGFLANSHDTQILKDITNKAKG
jgi:hypothetical protein